MALPQRQKAKKSRASLYLSILFHIVAGVAVFILAAKGGLLGKKMNEMVAFEVKEDKKPEKPKEQAKKEEPVKPKEETKEPPKTAAVPPPAGNATPPPVAAGTTIAAPAQVNTADFDFSDGAKQVESTSDPVQIYRGSVEYAFRSHWQKPEGLDDSQFVVELEVGVGADGSISKADWKRGTGDPKWDASVRSAVAATKSVGRAPPKNFPSTFIVRFDAVSTETEPVQ
jgi:outer membrane biosynthesis protein TonB